MDSHYYFSNMCGKDLKWKSIAYGSVDLFLDFLFSPFIHLSIFIPAKLPLFYFIFLLEYSCFRTNIL